jgi:hypothetical protein
MPPFGGEVGGAVTTVDDEVLKSLYAQKIGSSTIAKKTGLKPYQVVARLRAMDVQIRPRASPRPHLRLQTPPGLVDDYVDKGLSVRLAGEKHGISTGAAYRMLDEAGVLRRRRRRR